MSPAVAPFDDRTSDPQREAQRRQRAKNLAVGFIVGGLCLLFYLIAIVRMGRF